MRLTSILCPLQVIPGECHLTYNTRAPTVKENEALFARVKNCLEAAAHATGCSLEIEVGSTYTDVANCTALAEAYKGVMKQRYQRNIPYLTFPASTGEYLEHLFAAPLPNVARL